VHHTFYAGGPAGVNEKRGGEDEGLSALGFRLSVQRPFRKPFDFAQGFGRELVERPKAECRQPAAALCGLRVESAIGQAIIAVMDAGMSEAKPEPSGGVPPSPDRSRRVYVWWGVGFAFLGLLAVFCWLVVAPILQVRAVLGQLPAVDYLALYIPDDHALTAEAAIERLGGQRAAARKLSLFIRAPAWVQSLEADDNPFAMVRVPLREKAMALLGRCGEPGVVVLAGMIDGRDETLAGMAARSVIMGGPEAKAWAQAHPTALNGAWARLKGDSQR
jgi:hypothetical protein